MKWSIVVSVQSAEDRAVRLTRGFETNPSWNSGIVEIVHVASTGNICVNERFTNTEADVICHQLTFTGASTFSTDNPLVVGLGCYIALLNLVAHLFTGPPPSIQISIDTRFIEILQLWKMYNVTRVLTFHSPSATWQIFTHLTLSVYQTLMTCL